MDLLPPTAPASFSRARLTRPIVNGELARSVPRCKRRRGVDVKLRKWQRSMTRERVGSMSTRCIAITRIRACVCVCYTTRYHNNNPTEGALTQLWSLCRLLSILDACKMRNILWDVLRTACLNHPTVRFCNRMTPKPHP